MGTDPATLGLLSTSAAGASGGVSAGSSYAENRTNEQVAKRNAQQATYNAKDARIRGIEATRRVREQARLLIGSQRASLAARGFDLSTGTALAIQEDTASQAALDALTVENNYAREARGYETIARNERFQAKQFSDAAPLGLFSGILGASGDVLSAAAANGAPVPGATTPGLGSTTPAPSTIGTP